MIMNSKEIKYLLRSRSYAFAMSLRDKSHKLNSFKWNNKNVFYRTSSSDMVLIYEILLKTKYKSEYYFPEVLKPKVILDIGGNIGITSIFLSRIFPSATIYTFEPVFENYKILKKNTENYSNINIFNTGLGLKNGSFKVYLSDDSENFGGASFYSEGVGNETESFEECKVRNINDVIQELNLNQVDLIKIDTEGAEHDILTCLNDKILNKVSWITGELHGNRDFELLNDLDSRGFSISVNKIINNRLFMFNAGKKEIVSKLSKKEIKLV
jgi:FkbM family methyltransferase